MAEKEYPVRPGKPLLWQKGKPKSIYMPQALDEWITEAAWENRETKSVFVVELLLAGIKATAGPEVFKQVREACIAIDPYQTNDD